MNWISDFVDLKGLDIDKLIHRFTLSTAEVEEIQKLGSTVEKVVAGKILSIENHPKSKKLHLLKVDNGTKIVDVVCGAPNVREGMIVPFACEGGKAGGMDIVKATIAGYDSYGMCCSEAELGISADHSGLMELPEDTVVGTDIKKLYDIDDVVFEVDNKSLTNRPDLWGHYGIAREFAALTGRPLKPMALHDLDQYKKLPEVSIDIIDKEHCLRYSSIKVENVNVKVSPVNMRIRLFYCGMRAINLLADLTNYLMLEMGQPMHAFDLRKVDKVEVKRFDSNFEFETLDKTVRNIDPDTLMICSDGKPVAVAGIMGGYDSEIADDTDSLLIESANFDAVSVRKSTVRLGLRTDASMRYEKTLDPEMTVPAIGRFLHLLFSIAPDAKVISRLSDSYVKKYDTITLNFNKKYVDRYTGINITKNRIVKTLLSLGFDVTCDKNDFTVVVPSWRATKDVTIKADIIEEITRIYGYDNFEIKTTLSPLKPVRSSRGRVDDFMVKNLLADSFGLHEVHSYIWCIAKKYKDIGIEVEANPRLVNSISADTVLRRSMIPTQLTTIYDNKSFADSFGIFEIGRVVDGLREDGTCNERKMLGITLYSKNESEKQLYFRMKEIVCALGTAAKSMNFTLKNAEDIAHAWQHPVNSALIFAGDREIGSFYALNPTVAENIDKKAAVICAEIDMDIFAGVDSCELEFSEPSRFPGIDIDLSLLIAKNRPYGDITSVIDSFDCDTITGVTLVDIYENESLGNDHVVTVRIAFSHQERTLSGEEVNESVSKLIEKFEQNGIALRK